MKDSKDSGKYIFTVGRLKAEEYNNGPQNENKGKKLKDFHNDPDSILADLLIYEVLILRLYTSTTYRLFNGPMRSLLTTALGLKWKYVGSEKPSTGTEIENELLAAALQKQVEFKQDDWQNFHVVNLSSDSHIKSGDRYFKPDGHQSQHPLRFTIYALTEGVKKLRAVEAKSDEKGFNATKELWRGMANINVDKTFKSVGGTEMAVMSTTSDKEVALSYAQSKFPLVFKYNTVGLTRGVKIQFLSLYPKEVEYVYPLL